MEEEVLAWISAGSSEGPKISAMLPGGRAITLVQNKSDGASDVTAG